MIAHADVNTPAPEQTQPEKEFIGYLHAFRGVAILSIMGAHAWSGIGFASGVQEREPDYVWLYATTEALFHGTTLFFALISGVLFTRVLRGMSWKKFFLSKLVNVILPYIVVSTVLTAMAWPEIMKWARTQNVPVDFPTVLAQNLATGQAEFHLWYIPVLAVMFLLTPLLDRLLRLHNGALVLVLAALPLVVSRTVYPDLLSVKSLVYFLGAYSFGMYLGERLDRMISFVATYRTGLLIVFLVSLTVNFLLFRWEYVPVEFVSRQQVVVYVNKITAALLLLQWLHARGEHIPIALKMLGTYAFALYFVHFSFMWRMVGPLIDWFPHLDTKQVAVVGLGLYALATAASLLLGMGLKRLCGRHSRILIGV